MDEKNLFILSIRDFLTLKMLKYAILPFVITIVLMYILFFVMAGIGLEHLGSMDIQSTQTTMQNGIPHTESFSARIEALPAVEFLMNYAITSWIATFLVYAIGGFFTLYASIFVAIIVLGFLTPFVLKELQRRHYPDIELKGHSNFLGAIFLLLKWSFIMLVLFLLMIPLYFIPLVNIIALNFPLYYFFHKMLTYDISSNICTKDEEKKIRFFSANTIRLKTLALYLVSLIPFAIFFGAIFYVIYLGHTYFIETKKLRQL
ncbi:EI24 domain-containing protein [bacterium]|nr:EI24 domain-containing protein [bacterium]MBU1990669.1 EI24 domain-containing protein [bacterium]